MIRKRRGAPVVAVAVTVEATVMMTLIQILLIQKTVERRNEDEVKEGKEEYEL